MTTQPRSPPQDIDWHLAETGPSKAERVLVVSLQKSGTHLISRILEALGYRLYGAALRIEAGKEPRFSAVEAAEIARTVYPENAVQPVRDNVEGAYGDTVSEAWNAMGWYWQARLGVPVAERYGTARQEWIEQLLKIPKLANMRFCDTPANMCWVTHELSQHRADGRFFEDWLNTKCPRIIFNCRDPRDIVLSLVNYLSGATGRGFGCFQNYEQFAQVLSDCATFDDRLELVLTDTSFPCHQELREAAWMLSEPSICKVSFEELVGTRGGGSKDGQLRAIQRLCKHLEIDPDPALLEHLSGLAYSTSAFTYFRGTIGAWKSAFSARNIAAFDRNFGDIIKAYGYV